MHRKKLKNVRPTSQSNARTSLHGGLDFSSPPVYPHLINRVKKVMKEKDLQSRIRAENEDLKQKIIQIMDTGDRVPAREFTSGTRLDKNQYPRIDCYLNQTPSPWASGSGSVKAGKVNMVKKIRDYEEMVDSNRKLAERLTKTPSVYNRTQMAKDWAENESLRSRISQKRPRALRAVPVGVSSNGSVGSVSSLGSTMQSSLPPGPPQTAPIFSPVGGRDNLSKRSPTSESFSFLNHSNDRYRSPSLPCNDTETPWN